MSEWIMDGSDAGFMVDVVEASKIRPILVYFTAPWCAPCKQLGPNLESEIKAASGKVALVKMNVDQHPHIAGQLQVQSVPMVFGFVGGKPVDGFNGALPSNQIKDFIKKILKMAGKSVQEDVNGFCDAGDQSLALGHIETALENYAQALELQQDSLRGLAGIARCYAAFGEALKAREILSSIPPDMQKDPFVASAFTAIELAEKAEKVKDEIEGLRLKHQQNPHDFALAIELAEALAAMGEKQQAVDMLLDLYKKDRSWNDGAARLALVKLFEAFGGSDPITLQGRKKLSSLMFL